jgi:hypothetical protein
MGQRFQIIVQHPNGHFFIYHSQWLWGKFAIRRIGTAIKVFLKERYSYYSLDECLKASFYRLNDMNRISRYFEENGGKSDNALLKKESFPRLLRSLDNNDGYCYLVISERPFVSMPKIAYTFIQEKEGKLILLSAEDYMKDYPGMEQDKTQEKEYEANMKLFATLPQIKTLRMRRPK